jgi:hypothetical protein
MSTPRKTVSNGVARPQNRKTEHIMSNADNEQLPHPSEKQLTEAFRRLVDALISHRKKRAREHEFLRVEAIHASVLLATDQAILRARDIVADPVDRALKKGIKELAQVVYDQFGMDRLLQMAEHVCAKGRGGYGARMSPVDSALNGVGRGDDRWWS